jgi:hypothetical protein
MTKSLRSILVEETKPNYPHGAHDLLMKHGYTHFSHGKQHDGYIQKFGDMQMPVSKMKRHLEKLGYRPASGGMDKPSEFKDSAGRHQYTYDSPHKEAYADHKVSFDSDDGKRVRHFTSNVHRSFD